MDDEQVRAAFANPPNVRQHVSPIAGPTEQTTNAFTARELTWAAGMIVVNVICSPPGAVDIKDVTAASAAPARLGL